MNSNWQNVFNWIPASGVIINKENDNIQIDLTAQQDLAFNEFKIESHPQVVLKKQLNFDDQKGWSWHKSCNIPEIDYILELLQISNKFQQGCLFAQIFAVKALDVPQKYKNLGIKGESKKQIIDKQVNFKCLKFTTTSYNNKHEKFHLIIVLLYSNEQDVVLSSLISPEIFVDSRKFAQISHPSIDQHIFTEMFPYTFLDAVISKREIKNKTIKLIQVDDSITGFINYFSASNIRNKIKHPIFLALRFPSVIKLFVDNQLFNQYTNIASQIQNHLKNIINKVENQKKIMLLITPANQNNKLQKKAIELIQQLENSCYEIYTQQCYLPKNVYQIQDLQQLFMQYVELFDKSQQINSQPNYFFRAKTQSLSEIEIKVAPKVKIEYYPNNQPNNITEPPQTFRDINLTISESQNSIKQEEVLKHQKEIQQFPHQNCIQNSNIYQSQLFQQQQQQIQFYQNYFTNQQRFQNQYFNPYQFNNQNQNFWRKI